MILRNATPDDAKTIFDLISALAEYERDPGAVVTSPDELRRQLASPRPPFECVLAEEEGEALGFALFFHNYSTWRGKAGIYLEDLFVPPKFRGRGVGFALLKRLAAIAVDRGCPRMEFAVLNWNELAMDFYRSIGAEPLSEWTLWRLSDDALEGLAVRR